jgi:hypothetical protein
MEIRQVKFRFHAKKAFHETITILRIIFAETKHPKKRAMESKRISPKVISTLKENEIFVFGSNLSGHHGGGAARVAYEKFGAIWGIGVGIQGQSYGIPTMQGPVSTIKPYVEKFAVFAHEHPELKFLVTRIGCGIAGFTVQEIAPLFSCCKTLQNVYLPEDFIHYLA